MWFPQGSNWYDVSTGATYRGGTDESLRYTIDENPYFVRSGAVIPLAGGSITDLQHQSGELVLMVAPGCGRFETSLYEDDGSTESYHSAYATTHISKDSDAQRLTLSVEPRVGSFDGMLTKRNFHIVLVDKANPRPLSLDSHQGVKVVYDGKETKVNLMPQ